MKRFLVLLLLIIFVAGCFNSNSYEYNGYAVKRHSYGYSITVYSTYSNKLNEEPHIVNLRYGPKDLEDIKVEKSLKETILNSDQIYITTNPNESGKISIATIDIGKVLGTADWGVFKISTSSALTEPFGNITVKTCKDAVDKTTVLYLKTGNETRLYSEDRCIILEGKTEDDVIKLADRLTLNLLGVM